MSVRVTLLRNTENPSGGKLVLVPETFEELLALASSKLGISAKKIFCLNGAEVEDTAVIRNDDTLFVSEGEPFCGPSKTSSAKPRASSAASSPSSPSSQLVKTYRISVLGSGAVGKSNITLRFVKSIFIKEYDPTIEDAYNRPVEVDGSISQLQILDTAGQDEFYALFPTWVKNKDGFLLVYSVDRLESFDKVQVLYDMLLHYVPDDTSPPIVLCANKADLPEEDHKVSYDEGYRLASKWNVPFFQTSAKTGQNVEEAFHSILRQMRKVGVEDASSDDKKNAEKSKKKKKKYCNFL
eukprot:ANDGO_08509.mRNA.1 Ras-related protein Rap-1